MSAPTATVELYVDGTRVPSTPGELAAGQVTALDNLQLTWGRDGQNEQPGPASLTVELVDPGGTVDVLDVLHVGSQVAVWAEGQIPSTGEPGWVETFDDPTFQTYPVGPAGLRWSTTYTGGGPLTLTVADDPTAGHLARIEWGRLVGASFSVMSAFPPRPYSPPNELPDAWDDIPRPPSPSPVQWLYRCKFKAPAGSTVNLYPARFTGPYPSTAKYTAGVPSRVATGEWETWEYLFRPVSDASTGPAGSWQGVVVWINHPGPWVFWADQVGTWADQDPARTWDDPRYTPTLLVDDVSVSMPAGADTSRRVLVFSGEISDVTIAPWGDRVSTAVHVTAMDLGAELGNTVVGDTPWPVDTVAARADRVAQLAGITTSPRVRVDTPLDALQLSARDVDAQPAYALLQDVAQSAGGVLWAATHAVTGPFLWVENPDHRAATRRLVESGGVVVIVNNTGTGVILVSACDLLEEPVRWTQDAGDVATVVAVTWAEQGLDDDGAPTATERTVTVTDVDGLAVYGTRRLSIGTELIAAADATAYANRVLAQARAVGWRLDGLVWDTAADLADELDSIDTAARQDALLDLLDGTTRMGAAVTLVDMPPYAPRGAVASVYVEGGRYAYTADGWRLELGTTPSSAQGTSVTWDQLDPGWAWNEFAPAMRWVDLYGTTI